MIYDYRDFQVLVQTLLEPQEWCEVLKYSPSEDYLAVGSHDNSIYVYEVTAATSASGSATYQLFQVIKDRHSAAITAMDWSRDSVFLRSIDSAYLKNYFDIKNNNQIMDGAHTLTDPSLWQTSTCKLGWEVMGVFPPGTDGTDVNSVDANKSRTLLAVADDFGSLCVYRFPCVSNNQDCLRLTGHSEHVSRVKYLDGKQAHYLITAGGKDLTYIQWKRVFQRQSNVSR